MLMASSVLAAEDFSDSDVVKIKYQLIDGTIITDTQANRFDGKFEAAINSLLNYIWNSYNVKEIISINDVPLKDTEYNIYSKNIDPDKKGIDYSNSAATTSRVKLNHDLRLTFANISEGGVNVKIDDSYVRFDIAPFEDNGIIYLPFRSILEGLGYDINSDMNQYYKIVTARKKDNGTEELIEIRVDSKIAFNSKSGMVSLKASPIYKNYATFIALDDVYNLIGANVTYNKLNNSVTITMGSKGEQSE